MCVCEGRGRVGKGGGYEGLCIGLLGSLGLKVVLMCERLDVRQSYYITFWGLPFKNMMNDWRETGQEKSTCAAKRRGRGGGDKMGC